MNSSWDMIRNVEVHQPEEVLQYLSDGDRKKLEEEGDLFTMALMCVSRSYRITKGKTIPIICKLSDVKWSDVLRRDNLGQVIGYNGDFFFNFRNIETGESLRELKMEGGTTIVAPKYLCSLGQGFIYKTFVPKFDCDMLVDVYYISNNLRVNIAKHLIENFSQGILY